MNWYDEKADNPPLARPGVPNCEMSQAPLDRCGLLVSTVRIGVQQAVNRQLSRSCCEVLTSTNRSSKRQAPHQANVIDGHRAGIIEALSFCASMAPALLIRVPPEALRQRVSAGIGHIAGRARHSRSAASAGVRAFPDTILVEQRPIRFIL